MAYMNLTDETIRRLASAIGAEVGKVLARELAAIPVSYTHLTLPTTPYV